MIKQILDKLNIKTFSEMHWYRNKKDNNCNFYDVFN